MSDEKLALVLFDIGFVLLLVSMVLGPFGFANWAITAAAIACCMALGAMSIAFQGWDVPPEENTPETAETKEPANRE